MPSPRPLHATALAFALAASAALAQNPTAALSGRVTANGEAVPGVLVTAASPALQGSRSTTTSANGDYLLRFLPPGDYRVGFALEGFRGVEREVRLPAAQSVRSDVALELSDVAETIEVTGNLDSISSDASAALTIDQAVIDRLPVARDVRNVTLLTPGLNPNGPNAGISIAGAMSFDSLYLVNGVTVNENLRGQPLDLFIEDAIDETTVTVSGVSAEYGRFSGGVVNVLTKSGGNQLSGSLRTSLTNNRWESPTPLTTERIDDVNTRYEATLGGPILRDRLWFFGAARDLDLTTAEQAPRTGFSYQKGTEELRTEAKLTAALGDSHRLIGSWIDIDETDIGNLRDGLDGASLDDRELPQELLALNYTGVLSSRFFVEAQASRRKFSFVGSGSDFTDRIRGTWILDQPTGLTYNSPQFCGVCSDEKRDNQDWLVKASYFGSSPTWGSHDVVAGYDSFSDQRTSNNFQSGSNYSIYATGTRVVDGVPYPVLRPGGGPGRFTSTYVIYWPVLKASQGADFKTNSIFANDRWRLNDKWTFNLGARWDANDGRDGEGKLVAKDDRLSPRLGASFDPRGDGALTFNLSAGRYVSGLANSIGDRTSSAGTPAIFAWFYQGAGVNLDPSRPLVGSEAALQTVFDWFDSTGGLANQDDLFFVNIPGSTRVIQGSLDSPFADELALGVVKRIGSRGLVRADLVRREYHDFYSERIDRTTGRVETSSGPTERGLVENEDDLLERTYDGLHLQAQLRASDRLSFGGTYTLSRTRGNFIGETAGAGPVAGTVTQYPEYRQARWNSPVGYLPSDQRHRARLWAVWDLLSSERQHLTFSALQNYDSGVAYSAFGSIDPRPYVADLGYLDPPSGIDYYFSRRGAFRTDAITSTNLSLTYGFQLQVRGKRVELFVEPEVLNIFDEQGVVDVDTTVLTANDDPDTLLPFDPFNEAPVEGVNWRKGADFGKPLGPADYQTPRTFRLSVGVRF